MRMTFSTPVTPTLDSDTWTAGRWDWTSGAEIETAREVLGLEAGLAEDDLADRVVDGLLEARHVRALLLRPEVDDALQARREQLLDAVVRQADDLLDTRHAHA